GVVALVPENVVGGCGLENPVRSGKIEREARTVDPVVRVAIAALGGLGEVAGRKVRSVSAGAGRHRLRARAARHEDQSGEGAESQGSLFQAVILLLGIGRGAEGRS